MKALELRNPWKGAPILLVERTVSTMTEALALARGGFPTGTTVMANYQEGGRGRLVTRRWSSQAGKNLLFTLLLRDVPSDRAQRLPLLAGLAVSRVLERSFGLGSVIKWPNDVLCRLPAGSGGPGSGSLGKVAGVLCQSVSEAAGRVLLVGVGLNCNQLRFPGEPGAVALIGLLGREVDRLGVLEQLLSAIREGLPEVDWKGELLARLHGLGCEVTVRPALPESAGPGTVLRGTIEGLADDGALRLRSARGEPLVAYSGELELERNRAP